MGGGGALTENKEFLKYEKGLGFICSLKSLTNFVKILNETLPLKQNKI